MSLTFVNSFGTIKHILEVIKNKKSGVYMRYGDGDFNIARGLDDMMAFANSRFSLKMRESFKLINDEIIVGIPHHCKILNTVESGMFPGNHEYDGRYVIEYIKNFGESRKVFYTNVALHWCSNKYPDIVVELHKEIKTNKVLFIGNEDIKSDLLNTLFGKDISRINVPYRDAFNRFDGVMNEFKEFIDKQSTDEYFIIIMASGCAGRVFSSEIYSNNFNSNKNFFILDYGSLLDYFAGNISRAFMKLDPPNSEYILNRIT
jgi:hypothetical protein